jgi:hypothetical protein
MPKKTTTPDRSQWPIVRAYTPVPDAFAVSGFGMAGVVRRQPDGRFCFVMFLLNLSVGGIESMFGKDDFATVEELEQVLREATVRLPPWQPGPPELAARYVRGAFAWGRNCVDYPAAARDYLKMVPPLPGAPKRSDRWLVQMYLQEPALLSSDLLAAIEWLVEGPTDNEIPRGKEMAVATFMEFDVDDPPALRRVIESRPKDFHRVESNEHGDAFDGDAFYWIKPRRKHPGQRVPHGLIVLNRYDKNPVRAQAPTPSGASLLVMLLNELTDKRVRLRHVEWDEIDTLSFLPPGATVVPYADED